MKKIIPIILVLWMIIIFGLSSMNGTLSHNTSVSGIESIVTITYKITDKLGITNNKASNTEDISKLSEQLNYPIRKCLHVFEYFVLTIIIFYVLNGFGISYKKLIILSIVICILYACTDEIHQLFTGRTGRVIDVFIDSIGTGIAIILISIFKSKTTKDVLL